MARRTWLDDHLDALLDELRSFDLNVPRATAAELLRDQVQSLAQDMDVSERTARGYITPEMIRDLARTLAFSIVDEHPGADVFALPRNAVLPWAGLGRLFTALAEAGRVRLVNDDPGGEATAFQLISTDGLLAHDPQPPAQDGTPERGGVSCPSAMRHPGRPLP